MQLNSNLKAISYHPTVQYPQQRRAPLNPNTPHPLDLSQEYRTTCNPGCGITSVFAINASLQLYGGVPVVLHAYHAYISQGQWKPLGDWYTILRIVSNHCGLRFQRQSSLDVILLLIA